MSLSIADRVSSLLGRTRAGITDEEFAALYARAHVIVFRYVYGLCGGPWQEVEDLTAETFLRAWRAHGRFEGNEEAAVGWLLQIARRQVIDAYRRRRLGHDDRELILEYIPAPDAGPEEQAQARERWGILWRLLAELPDDQREMLVLRYMLGWRVNRIARHFGLAENTVSVTLRRVLQRLRRAWPQPQENVR